MDEQDAIRITKGSKESSSLGHCIDKQDTLLTLFFIVLILLFSIMISKDR